MEEPLLLLLALVALGLPIASIIAAASALRRNRELRRALSDFAENNGKIILSLRQEISQLRKQVAPAWESRATAPAPEEPAERPLAPVPQKPAAAPVAPKPLVIEVPPTTAPEPQKQPFVPPQVIPPAPAPPISLVVPHGAPAAPPPPRPALPGVPPRVAMPSAPRSSAPASSGPYRVAPPRPSFKDRLKSILDLEEVLGTNWMLKLGVILLVLGVALLGILKLGQVGPWGKVLASYGIAVALLVGGIYLEKRERYNLIGRVSIGGGWALFFFSTYAMHHVAAMQVILAQPLDLALMLVVALAMTVHTLRYRSQLVTGFAFLLGYSTVALAQDTVYALSAGIVLGIGLVTIVLRTNWFELEVFGILSAYLNHLYWLYRLFVGNGLRGGIFPEYRASLGLLLFYWLIFRFSYVSRGIRSHAEERVSTIAAILNPLLLLAAMKYQSAQPQLAWIALLAIGGLEFSIANFPWVRRRREAFIVLSVIGTALMAAAVPMHYTDNAVILWLAGAQAFLISGTLLREVVFRRLGLVLGLLVALRLVIFHFPPLLNFRESSDALALVPGILFGVCALVFYLNLAGALTRWREFFPDGWDRQLLLWQSYAGGFAAAASIWALLRGDWTAVGFAGLMVVLALLSHKLHTTHQRVQFVLAGALLLVRILSVNLHVESPAGAHLALRIVTLPLLAAAFYVTAKLAALGEDEIGRMLRGILAAVGTALLAALLYLEVPEYWQPAAAMLLGVVLVEAGRRLAYRALLWHAHAVAFLAVAAALATGRPGGLLWHGVSYHAVAAVPVILGAYWLAWRLGRLGIPLAAGLGNAYRWAATGVIFALVSTEASDIWMAVAYLAAGILLALAGRRWNLAHLSYQEYVFALAAAVSAFEYNLHSTAHYRSLDLAIPTVALVAAGLYAISRKAAPQGQTLSKAVAYLHTTAATALLALLAYYEASTGWLAALWAVFALVLAATDRRFRGDDLRWQAHALAAVALVRSLTVNLYVTETWHGLSIRLLSLASVAVVFYVMSALIRMPENLRKADFHHVYSWAASTVVSLLLWYELEPLSKALGWAVFGLVLFEYGLVRKIVPFRQQAYLAFTAAFVRIFFANLTVGAPGELWSPRFYTVLPLILIFYFVYAQLGAEQEAAGTGPDGSRLTAVAWFAYLGTLTLVALLYFQVISDWVIVSWALVVFALLVLATFQGRPIFLHQGLLLILAVLARGMAHNLFGASYFTGSTWTGRYLVLSSAAATLLLALPLAFRLRGRFPGTGARGWQRLLAAAVRRPEQLVFFAPVTLVTFMLLLKMNAGMITISWGIEGLLIILLALAVGERSFRLAGLGLLLLCVAKVMTLDLWRLPEKEERYLTLVVLGAALVTVSLLYTRYREAIRRYL